MNLSEALAEQLKDYGVRLAYQYSDNKGKHIVSDRMDVPLLRKVTIVCVEVKQ